MKELIFRNIIIKVGYEKNMLFQNQQIEKFSQAHFHRRDEMKIQHCFQNITTAKGHLPAFHFSDPSG
ncbi:Uncharacterized protein dnm_062810 [Desulfonema magnum]|uniref:Uncharacterized protein n=1 Tax=Desulfonema magnum TaxID=45655 RepID=A0A975BSF1_9BACT|nr:Uncharacterized protein dnm_062810 [Desulfonema magnum]